MPEKPKEKACEEITDKRPPEAPPSYYYDDAHGYETFDPDEDANDAEQDETDPERNGPDVQ